MKKNHLLIPCLAASLFLFTGCSSQSQTAQTQTTKAQTEQSQSQTAQTEDAEKNIGAIQVRDGEGYTNENGTMSADIVRPVFVDSSGKELNIPANKEISQYIDSLIEEYKEKTEENYFISTSYEVTHDGSQYLSLRMITTSIMASADESFHTYTIDKKDGETVSLMDLLGDEAALEKVSQNILSQMQAQMEADDTVSYFISPENEDGFTGLTGNESFYLNKDNSLVVAFDESTVAPGSMGTVEFTIPEDVTGTFN